MLKVKHVMSAWLFLLALIFIAIVVIAPIALMFLNGTPQVRDIGNYLLLFVVAVPIGLIVTLAVGFVTLPFAVLLCATDRPPTAACPACAYDLEGNLTGVCPECGAELPDELVESPAAQPARPANHA